MLRRFGLRGVARTIRDRAVASGVRLQLWAHPLRTHPALGMAVFIDALLAATPRPEFEEVRRIHAWCHSRDRRPVEGRGGSTRIADCNFLYLLVRWLRPRMIFEVGTLIGTSASVMAQALIENGDGGIVYTVDGSYTGFEPIEGQPIRRFAGQLSSVALETIRNEGGRIDLVFVDGAIGRRDIELLNEVKPRTSVIALHDYKLPAAKGVRNAWRLARELDFVERSFWVLPERQGLGYEPIEGLLINSSVAVLLPEDWARALTTAQHRGPRLREQPSSSKGSG